MHLWLKRVLWIIATFALVWMAAILYWQNTARIPAQSELLIYLGLIPLAFLGTGWGILKAVTYQSPPSADTAAAAKLKAGEYEAQKAFQDAEQQRNWHLNIVATTLQTSAGSTAADVLAKLKEGDVQAELDSELKNEDGFAVFSARIADLDVTETVDALNEWQKTSGSPDLQWGDAQLRALHLASAGISELAAVAAGHPEVLLLEQRAEKGRAAVDDAVPSLQVAALWPPRWEQAHQLAATGWLKSLVVAQGWPERRIFMQQSLPEQASPLELLDQFCLKAGRTQLPTVGILMACDSSIDQDEVDALTSKSQLFGGKNTGGVKPGEVAAGLLFADHKQAQMFGQEALSKLHRASWSLRGKSADERGKISADLLGTVVAQALASGKVDAKQLKFVSADNDHKPNREAELAQMFNGTLPELDCLKDAAKVAQTCGSAQHAITVAALCVAHQYVVDEKLPAVCVSLQSPFLRAAVALNPHEIGEDSPASQNPADTPVTASTAA